MPIEKIKKRNGTVVDFERDKIEEAISKACIAVKADIPRSMINDVTDAVIAELEKKFSESIPEVENVQDIVEQQIATKGLFPVARAYIVYREERKLGRELAKQQLLQKMKTHELNVIKRDGTRVEFDVNEISEALINCCEGVKSDIDANQVIQEALTNLYDGISTREINQAVVMALKAKIEQEPNYSRVAARLLFNDLYKDVLGADEFTRDFTQKYRDGLAESVRRGVVAGRLDERLLNFDFSQLAKELHPKHDRLFTYLAAQTLYDRYFLRDLDQNLLETPQYFWMRVAMGLSLDEPEKEMRAVEFYHTMATLRYVPSTPTLFHAGTTHPQMSSCYLTTVNDDLGHIFKSISDNAQLSKWSGGLGNDWTNIRATGAQIKSTNVGSQGVVPFLKIADATTAAINRSGKRRGATCVYLETWHLDIEDFLELRKNTGDERRRTHDTNTAHWIPDLFMKRVMADQHWTLFSPDETPDLHGSYGSEFERKYEAYEQRAEQGHMTLFKKIKAKELWRRMITSLFETGHPWITFKDPCNIRSPQDHVGVVHSSNLCTEITLNTSAEETAVCNLGSVNLVRHISDGQIDRDGLEQTIGVAMRMLDNVIDLNFYPTAEARTANLRHRPVGLGIMGLQDMLYKIGLNFDSEAAVRFSDEVMELISHHAILGSSKLAKERGTYESYQGSKWDRGLFPLDTLTLLEQERGIATGVSKTAALDWTMVKAHVAEHGMRNSNCMAIAPTATISNIAGAFPSIEPIYKNIYVKSNVSGEFTTNNGYLIEELKERGLWSKELVEKLKHYDGSIQKIDGIPADIKEKYKEVFEIDPIWIIKHAAARGKWIDQSQSVNIFINTTSGKVISEVYANAWRMGLKTTYYLRGLGASAVEKSTLDVTKQVSQPVAMAATVEPPVIEPALRSNIYIAKDAICEACQ